MRESSMPGNQWLCSRSADDIANIIRENNKGSDVGKHDPLNLIWIVERFRRESVFPGLI